MSDLIWVQTADKKNSPLSKIELKVGKKTYVNGMFQNKKFSLNVCGEGGEYETFTLDCPLFKKEIIM